MELDIIGLLASFSYALDHIEAELVGVTTGHAKRVAYMSVMMAEQLGVEQDAIRDLAACALLHDSALTQYLEEEYQSNVNKVTGEKLKKDLWMHCVYGEINIKKYPLRKDTKNVILYHHEAADGSGPFGKTWKEVHLFSRIIFLCDSLDRDCKMEDVNKIIWKDAEKYLRDGEGHLFDSECVDAFFKAFDEERFLQLKLENADLDRLFWEKIPRKKKYYSYQVLRGMIELFARITDYKSPFTSRHSIGVAESVETLATYMGYDDDMTQKLYIAGALHDIGKIVIKNEILEKPAKLTDTEYTTMKNHAWYTYVMLSKVDGFEEITKWASYHHERLDGSGYPFGKTEEELDEPARMMACIDIYQALREDRPYKKGMTHEKACTILRDMAEKHWIDGKIVKKIEECFSHL